MRLLVVVPTQAELDALLQAWLDQGYQTETAAAGKLTVICLPVLDITVAHGGLGKARFAVHTQHLLDAAHWDLVSCAGGAGALVDSLAAGDVVIATETVEHDIRNRFGPPLLPRFGGSEQILRYCQTLPAGPGFHIHFGPVASGDEDVVDLDRRQAIHERTGALAVAWEGAGGARAAQFSQVPFVEIRGITDGANSTAASDFGLNLQRAMDHVARVLACLQRRRMD